MKKVYFFLFLFFCPALLLGCGNPMAGGAFSGKDFPEETGFYFDTVISVRLYEGGSEEILSECMELAGFYENLFSPKAEGGDVWNINHSGGEFVTVHEDTLSLLQTALDFAESSGGLVDPTVGSLSGLWGFGSDCPETVPEQALIEEALCHVNYDYLEIKGSQVRLTDPESQIELGFIAKGFIGDKMKAFLSSRGVSSALINLGGNVVTLGGRPDKSPFKVGIRDPFEESGDPLLVLEASDISVVSSGNYERFFEKDGRRYHHILSTETGYPVESGLSQVTILSPDSACGDALSTLCFILGYEKAVSLLKNYPGVRAIFVMEDGTILSSDS